MRTYRNRLYNMYLDRKIDYLYGKIDRLYTGWSKEKFMEESLA